MDYHLSPKFGLLGLFGYNKFKSKVSGVDDTYWINLSANIKYLFSLGRILPYVNFGPGYYIPKTGNSEFCANFGFGFDYNFNISIVIELGADYHKIFDF